MSSEGFYRSAVRAFSISFIAIGLAIQIVTLVNGGHPASTGFVLGLAFQLVGVGRLWLSSKAER